MADITPPSVNLADLGSMTGMFRHILNKFLQNTDDMLPAVVKSYDRAKKRATVQPLIMVLKTNNQLVPRAAVASVPVLQLGGGNVVLDFNLEPGDLGFIKANDRDISLFLNTYKQAAPGTLRIHDFSSSIFIPAPLTGYSIESEDAGNCVLQTKDGTQRIAIWPDRIKITSNNKIVLDAPETEMTGRLVTGTNGGYGGDSTINGTLHATIDVTGATISLVHHVHSGVQSGSNDTGQPVP